MSEDDIKEVSIATTAADEGEGGGADGKEEEAAPSKSSAVLSLVGGITVEPVMFFYAVSVWKAAIATTTTAFFFQLSIGLSAPHAANVGIEKCCKVGTEWFGNGAPKKTKNACGKRLQKIELIPARHHLPGRGVRRHRQRVIPRGPGASYARDKS